MMCNRVLISTNQRQCSFEPLASNAKTKSKNPSLCTNNNNLGNRFLCVCYCLRSLMHRVPLPS